MPHPAAGFTWDKLGEFDYSSNLQAFFEAVHAGNLTKPNNVNELQAAASKVSSYFCTPEA